MDLEKNVIKGLSLMQRPMLSKMNQSSFPSWL
ncbi:hypothetical protein P872_15870 [Rhodonellum psychrophilum GCM71 = DSM 17998]|uniref:Uncharacterized protein n=1 Tax=Rhodonellum psychrophilum GCM71 = DSM 17998 TaxID=1123057 RepID=U5C364_9BACT|nr:hypothetical protein P872_15870 [Rhodonellum psychrophilum GCM71 = DSM 17998]